MRVILLTDVRFLKSIKKEKQVYNHVNTNRFITYCEILFSKLITINFEFVFRNWLAYQFYVKPNSCKTTYIYTCYFSIEQMSVND